MARTQTRSSATGSERITREPVPGTLGGRPDGRGRGRKTKMSRHQIALAAVLIGLAASPAAAGSLDVWEDSRGARDITALFPTGAAQAAHIVFDASSAETGGLIWGVSDIEILAKGSIDFVDFSCELQGCN